MPCSARLFRYVEEARVKIFKISHAIKLLGVALKLPFLCIMLVWIVSGISATEQQWLRALCALVLGVFAWVGGEIWGAERE